MTSAELDAIFRGRERVSLDQLTEAEQATLEAAHCTSCWHWRHLHDDGCICGCPDFTDA